MDSEYIGSFFLDENYTLYVKPEEDDEPVFYVDLHSPYGTPDSCFFLTKPVYYGKESLETDFSVEGLEDINDMLLEDSDEVPGKSVWEVLCDKWNMAHGNKVSFPKEQPDYKLTKDVIERRRI